MLRTALKTTASRLFYHSRAHPRPTPLHAVRVAVDTLLQDIQQRQKRRERKYKRNSKPDDKGHLDETFELAVSLNIDPRRSGQGLRGSLTLPHGTGKTMNCLVFTADEELAKAALAAGAQAAGGASLMDQVVSGDVVLNKFQRCLATREIMPELTKKLARLLGPRGLMPNVKVGTLLEESSQLLGALETQMAGKEVTYRAKKEGIVHVPVGKGSLGTDKILENIGQVMTTIFEAKPENYGKGKKGSESTGKGTRYVLRASVSSTQGKGFRLDLRTIDPNNLLFLTSGEEGSATTVNAA